MPKEKAYKNAPITEALIDIRTIVSPDSNLNIFNEFFERVKDRYPRKEQRATWKADFKFAENTQLEFTPPVGGPDGFLLHSVPDTNKIVQVRRDGFTFNKLKPYSSWNEFSAEAQELWELYYEIIKPSKIVRLAVRYINRIEIPNTCINLRDYFLTVPEISKSLNRDFSKFFLRLEMPDLKNDAMAILIETIAPIKSGDVLKVIPIVFDIDVFKKVNFDKNDPKIWGIMELLRSIKNDIFENSLTDKAKSMFDE